MKKRKPTRKRPRPDALLVIGGDSTDRRELVKVLAANLPRAIDAGQREIVASLIQGIAGTFPTTTSINGCNFTSGDR